MATPTIPYTRGTHHNVFIRVYNLQHANLIGLQATEHSAAPGDIYVLKPALMPCETDFYVTWNKHKQSFTSTDVLISTSVRNAAVSDICCFVRGQRDVIRNEKSQ